MSMRSKTDYVICLIVDAAAIICCGRSASDLVSIGLAGAFEAFVLAGFPLDMRSILLHGTGVANEALNWIIAKAD